MRERRGSRPIVKNLVFIKPKYVSVSVKIEIYIKNTPSTKRIIEILLVLLHTIIAKKTATAPKNNFVNNKIG
ncbi:hypothetical protein HO345_02190 [Treponema denticola]|uniref:hypothetical protein n=1 Tax=Treponema denticola TaxID=158 RepID=UPI0020A3FE77|nr:hypothetical protein [Treponema denticola]UTD11876.1 hypothetical protein HO345_02190 [Treponema denticola]